MPLCRVVTVALALHAMMADISDQFSILLLDAGDARRRF